MVYLSPVSVIPRFMTNALFATSLQVFASGRVDEGGRRDNSMGVSQWCHERPDKQRQTHAFTQHEGENPLYMINRHQCFRHPIIQARRAPYGLFRSLSTISDIVCKGLEYEYTLVHDLAYSMDDVGSLVITWTISMNLPLREEQARAIASSCEAGAIASIRR